MPESFRAPIGTQDVLPPESARWQRLIATFAGVAERLGVGTEVVRKEMYDFRDKGDRHLALRPEATASVARAYVQHRPPTPWKVWCLTPAWRYERPQAGRLPPGPRPAPLAAGPQHHGNTRRPRRLRRDADGVAARACGGPGARGPREDRRPPPAGARLQASRDPGRRCRRPPHGRRARRCLAPPLRAGPGRAAVAPYPLRGRARAGPGTRLLHTHPVRVPERGPRHRPVHGHRRGAPPRTGRGAPRAPPPPPPPSAPRRAGGSRPRPPGGG